MAGPIDAAELPDAGAALVVVPVLELPAVLALLDVVGPLRAAVPELDAAVQPRVALAPARHDALLVAEPAGVVPVAELLAVPALQDVVGPLRAAVPKVGAAVQPGVVPVAELRDAVPVAELFGVAARADLFAGIVVPGPRGAGPVAELFGAPAVELPDVAPLAELLDAAAPPPDWSHATRVELPRCGRPREAD